MRKAKRIMNRAILQNWLEFDELPGVRFERDGHRLKVWELMKGGGYAFSGVLEVTSRMTHADIIEAYYLEP